MVQKYDLICCGAGIMSLTLATLCKSLDPNLKIAIFEKLSDVGLESSAAWNNAGTGHSAFCELNYTPEINGKINIDKAIHVCQQFDISRQFWAHLVESGLIQHPTSFINAVPHHSWVSGDEDVSFLKKRYLALSNHPLFEDLQYSEDHDKMHAWFPLIMKNRADHTNSKMAATRMEEGTEVNFGMLCRHLKQILTQHYNVDIFFEHEVLDVDPDETIDWTIEVKDLSSGSKKFYDSEHIFIGTGGGALPLLQKVEIEEKKGYGGFPVSGQWLVCKNEQIINEHWAKVYFKAGVGSPPMSTPHLDTRFIDGKRALLFGPFAGFNTKFLKEGSYLDLLLSVKWDNIPSLWGAFWHNLPLTKYLIQQVAMNHKDRMETLRKYMLHAADEDWELLQAGQRVQIIKRDKEQGGSLEFGTEVIYNSDGKITALLGASPGASTAVSIMMDVIKHAFPELLNEVQIMDKLNRMIPFWNKALPWTGEAIRAERKRTSHILQFKQHT